MATSLQSLSKRAIKRQLKFEKSKEQRKLKKLAMRKEDNTCTEKRERMEPLVHEPRSLGRIERKQALKESFENQQSSFLIVIDASFESFMTESENKSILQQISRSYSSNRDAAIPAQLSICGLSSTQLEKLESMGAKTWQNWGTKLHTDPIEKVFQTEKLVYQSKKRNKMKLTKGNGSAVMHLLLELMIRIKVSSKSR